MKELLIEKIEFLDNGEGIKCYISEAGVPKVLWVQTDSENAKYLCDDRADGFFIICLYKAIKEGYNLVSKVPVSDRTYYQATSFMNRVYAETFGKSPIEIDVPTTNKPLQCANAVGTGISMGVDSLYTIEMHSEFNPACPETFKVTHLVLMNAGAFISSKEPENETFLRTQEKAKRFCAKYGYRFVSINTNILEFIPYWQMEWHGIVNGAVILTMQKLFSKYYSSSSYKFSEFQFNPKDLSMAELFNLMVLSNDNTTFYSTGGDVLRIDKVGALTRWEPSYDFLQVCAYYSHNCSEYSCQKCGRTMAEIDAFDALDKYSKSFDVEAYKAAPYRWIEYLYARKVLLHDHYVSEMWPLLQKKYPMSIIRKAKALCVYAIDRMKYFGWRGLINKITIFNPLTTRK